ncbi:DM13 domain-containing protein [Pelagibius litoralis]|uniref:DM13 domain-containing protein n=1 Tax=Pelagibius litoralis TaxID=374515 RepID=A0A967EVC2_9PROT|nr:DM13 domain-containing protein [Pelagibius litoralis]NIA68466.1 DM13 domain-containing protein [Pelagibius litoralis]
MLRNFMLALAVIAGVGTVYLGTAAGPAQAASHTEVLKSGKFSGLSDHVTTGGVSIIETASGYIAVLETDFSLDGAPAPSLGFGNNATFDKATEFTKLDANTGLQVYAIPAGINPADFSEFYVWCADFTVPLGVANLK